MGKAENYPKAEDTENISNNLSSDHRNIEINNTEKPSLCICLFIGDNWAIVYTVNGTRTVYIFTRKAP